MFVCVSMIVTISFWTLSNLLPHYFLHSALFLENFSISIECQGNIYDFLILFTNYLQGLVMLMMRKKEGPYTLL